MRRFAIELVAVCLFGWLLVCCRTVFGSYSSSVDETKEPACGTCTRLHPPVRDAGIDSVPDPP